MEIPRMAQNFSSRFSLLPIKYFEDCFYQRKELETTPSFTQVCITPRSTLQRKDAFHVPRNIKNKLPSESPSVHKCCLCTQLFAQSTEASLSISNSFSKLQQGKFCIGPHGYQIPLLYLNPSKTRINTDY